MFAILKNDGFGLTLGNDFSTQDDIAKYKFLYELMTQERSRVCPHCGQTRDLSCHYCLPTSPEEHCVKILYAPSINCGATTVSNTSHRRRVRFDSSDLVTRCGRHVIPV